jgi:hypothetical protein
VLPNDEGEYVRDMKRKLNTDEMEFGVLYVGRKEINTYLQNIINDELTDDPSLPNRNRMVYEAGMKDEQEEPRRPPRNQVLQTKMHLQEEGSNKEGGGL